MIKKNILTFEGFFNNIASGAKTWMKNVNEKNKVPVTFWIKCYGKSCIINSPFYGEKSSDVIVKLMEILKSKFDLKTTRADLMHWTLSVDSSKLNDISDFLLDIGLERIDSTGSHYGFKGNLSMSDLNNLL